MNEQNEQTFENGNTPETNSQPQIAVVGSGGVGIAALAGAIMSSEQLYPLDWNTTEVKLSKGRFVHTLARPSNELLLERADDLDTEIPIAKDGSYAMPDEQEQEAIDAKYYVRVKASEPIGYGERDVPTLHKATAFQGLFLSEIEADEDADIFDEEIKIVEEIGSGDEADFTVGHFLRTPEEKELNKIRKIFRNGRLAPDKRGRQKFVEKSNLRKAMAYYAQYLSRIEGATVAGQKFSAENRNDFIANVNALTQRAVVKAMVEQLTGKLLD